MDKDDLTKSLQCILLVFMSPIALLILVLLALLNLLRFLFKVALLFVIVAINTPFAVMYNVSILVVEYHFQQYFADIKKSDAPSEKSDASSGTTTAPHWNWSDPRASVGTDVQMLVSDFLKTVAAELLVAVSTGVITFYTSPIYVFYISTTVGVAVVFHKWLNTDSPSKAALACLCGGYGLNPMMILFSFIGLFDIGGHPVAKCSFAAKKAFLFEKDSPMNRMGHIKFPPKDGHQEKICHHRFSEMAGSNVEQVKHPLIIDSFTWNAFERGWFRLIPKIIFQNLAGKYVLESFMVLKYKKHVICEYLMERLELPEDYSKPNELYHFLDFLSSNDAPDGAFVTDKLRGRYEQSLTLLQIAEGVEKNDGFKTVPPKDYVFVVAGCTNK